MKTIRETILSFPGLSDCGEYIDKVLTDRAVTGSDPYTRDHRNIVDLCAADLYVVAGGDPDFVENKLQITHPRSWYNTQARLLYRKGGEPEMADQIGQGIDVPRGKSGGRW